ncbi:MAG: type I methionyl aminopeptidase [Lentisphaeria bacterium]|nr:type I methionyl aminopeptidase [Lentisphaeria bacterium]
MDELKRNDLCWCGSGRKYKRCHMVIDANPLGQGGRRIPTKSPAEIEGVRKASRLASQTLDMVTERIAPGVTTNEINQWVHEYTLAHNARPAPLGYRGYPKSVCTSINEVICHGIPQDRVLLEGDIINVDVTSILDGYYGDTSRMFMIGQVSEEAKKLVEVTKQCLDIGIDQVKPGRTFGDIGYHIQQYAESLGYSVVREFSGHGTGCEFHEPPEVLHYGQPGKGPAIRPGMIFTIEPMINLGKPGCRILADNWTAVTIDGALSAQWEHTVVATEDGVEILTQYS